MVNARGVPGRDAPIGMRPPRRAEPSPKRMRVAGGRDDRVRGREDGEEKGVACDGIRWRIVRLVFFVGGDVAPEVGRRGRVRSWTPTTHAAQSRPDVGSREVDLRAGGEDARVMSVVGGVVLKVLY